MRYYARVYVLLLAFLSINERGPSGAAEPLVAVANVVVRIDILD
jgi:hypothetical protein